MSTQSITEAARREWQQLLTGESYENFLTRVKSLGYYWGAE